MERYHVIINKIKYKGGIAMRREARKRKHVKRVGNLTYDKNERFVFKKSATYLCRHLTRYSSIDNNTIEVICSIMGHEMKQIGELLLDRFPLLQKDEFEDIPIVTKRRV
jgi:hypothetical protein